MINTIIENMKSEWQKANNAYRNVEAAETEEERKRWLSRYNMRIHRYEALEDLLNDLGVDPKEAGAKNIS